MKTLELRGFDEKSHMRLRIMAVAKGVRMAKIVEKLVDEAWEKDKTLATPEIKRRLKRLLRNYAGDL